MVTMNLFLLVIPSLRWRTWIPEATTLVNRKVVIPPRTQSGMVRMIAENLAMTPKMKSHAQQAKPARRDAHRERDMTPLFCAYVVTGTIVASAAQKELRPSARMAPCTDLSNSAPACSHPQ